MDDQVTIDDVYDRIRQGEWSSEDFKDWLADQELIAFIKGLNNNEGEF